MISEDLQTTKTHWHPKNSASDIKSVTLMLQMFHWKYVPRKSVSSPGHHLTDASSFLHRLSQSSLVLNVALWAVLAVLTDEATHCHAESWNKPSFHQSPHCTKPRSAPCSQIKRAKDTSKPHLVWSMLSHQLVTTNSTNSAGCHCNNWYKQSSPLLIKRSSKL